MKADIVYDQLTNLKEHGIELHEVRFSVKFKGDDDEIHRHSPLSIEHDFNEIILVINANIK